MPYKLRPTQNPSTGQRKSETWGNMVGSWLMGRRVERIKFTLLGGEENGRRRHDACPITKWKGEEKRGGGKKACRLFILFLFLLAWASLVFAVFKKETPSPDYFGMNVGNLKSNNATHLLFLVPLFILWFSRFSFFHVHGDPCMLSCVIHKSLQCPPPLSRLLVRWRCVDGERHMEIESSCGYVASSACQW